MPRRRTSTFAGAAAATAAAAVLGGLFFAGRAVPRGRVAERPALELPVPTATDGEIAIRNLDADVTSLEARVERAPEDVGLREALASLLLTRGEYLGIIADYERSNDLAEDCVRRRPKDPKAFLARASARAVFHRFDEAWADLDRAEALGAPPSSLAGARASSLAARGHLDEALAIVPRDEATLDSMGLASLGLLDLETSHGAEGSRLLDLARKRVRDASPLPLAWMDYREGELAEREGDKARARALYQRAHALLPRYAAAGAHLAAYLPVDRSIPILRRIAERSDDPEVGTVLGRALRAHGDGTAARAAETAAASRYDELVTVHPAAFADHAARFWLGPGDDPEKAHSLALLNLRSRQSATAFDLALTTAMATGRADEACRLAGDGLSLAYADETFRTIARAVTRDCEVAPL